MISTLVPALAGLLAASPAPSQLIGSWDCSAIDGDVQMEMDPEFFTNGTVAMDIQADVPMDETTMGHLHMVSFYDYEIDGDDLVMNFTRVDFKSFLIGDKSLTDVLGQEAATELEAILRDQLADDLSGETRDRIDQLDGKKLVFVSYEDGLTTSCTRK